MEYKLNKIDVELRQQVNDAAKDGKVHSKEDIEIRTQDKEEKKKKPEDYGYKLKKFKSVNKKLIVNAVKVETINVEAYKEEEKKSSLLRGTLLDVKK